MRIHQLLREGAVYCAKAIEMERDRALSPRDAGNVFGCVLAMRVLQSNLYASLDDTERAECDELIARWNDHLRPAQDGEGKA